MDLPAVVAAAAALARVIERPDARDVRQEAARLLTEADMGTTLRYDPTYRPWRPDRLAPEMVARAHADRLLDLLDPGKFYGLGMWRPFPGVAGAGGLPRPARVALNKVGMMLTGGDVLGCDRDEFLEALEAVRSLAAPPWEGNDWDELQPVPKRLLLHMRGRERAAIDDAMCEYVWLRPAEAVTSNAVHQAITKSNNFLLRQTEKRILSKVRREEAITWV
jgi:hypothetical protein